MLQTRIHPWQLYFTSSGTWSAFLLIVLAYEMLHIKSLVEKDPSRTPYFMDSITRAINVMVSYLQS